MIFGFTALEENTMILRDYIFRNRKVKLRIMCYKIMLVYLVICMLRHWVIFKTISQRVELSSFGCPTDICMTWSVSDCNNYFEKHHHGKISENSISISDLVIFISAREAVF